MKAFSFAAILVSVCAMAACKVGDGTGSGGAGGDGGSGGSDTTTTTTSGTGGEGGEAGGTGEGGGGECAEEAAEECDDCCDMAFPDEYAALNGHGFWQCGCVADSPCADVCDTTDATTDACGEDGTVNLEVQNADCVACLDEVDPSDACYEAATTACDDDEDCKPYLGCLLSCQ
ncbi:hypothetical protein WME89_35695 [Sorangium sp. So ce321]|uniref:hypothetical protein n=1 Tax=Sorangium sp. So ce321 TaxID=3133300 RepID=UPI003F62AF12